MPILDAPDILSALSEQDNRLRFARFEHDDALAVGTRIIELARSREQTISTSVWLGEQLVFQAALAGTSADNDSWMNRKVATVRHFDTASLSIMKRLEAYGVTDPATHRGVDRFAYAFNGGAVPIRIGATQVGVVVASGVDDYVEHDLVVEALDEHLASARGAAEL
ncbi:heme-degrading domain-containing protein [Frondihabitans cladoniiphilus]|uniref:Heme-degrading domain-containing protein n=1 Tax=Frondihabitans cladoniiphilus TaxID=715785 RepID=A0ABP8WEF0_9MICO